MDSSNVTRRNFVGMGAMVAAGMGMAGLAAKPAQAHDNSWDAGARPGQRRPACARGHGRPPRRSR